MRARLVMAFLAILVPIGTGEFFAAVFVEQHPERDARHVREIVPIAMLVELAR